MCRLLCAPVEPDPELASTAPAAALIPPQHPQDRPAAVAGEDGRKGDAADTGDLLVGFDALQPLMPVKTGVTLFAECAGLFPSAGATEKADVLSVMPFEELAPLQRS